jgi:uncharacterized OB-fold protein
MTFEMGPETRQVQGTWDVSTYKYRMDGTGVHLLAQAMKEKKIKGLRCPECGTVYVPGPTYCKKCFVDIDEVVEVKDTGTVMSYTVEMADVRGNPRDDFLINAMIKLDGADSWFVSTVQNIDWQEFKVGMRVKAVWIDEPVGSMTDIDHFEVIGE